MFFLTINKEVAVKVRLRIAVMAIAALALASPSLSAAADTNDCSLFSGRSAAVCRGCNAKSVKFDAEAGSCVAAAAAQPAAVVPLMTAPTPPPAPPKVAAKPPQAPAKVAAKPAKKPVKVAAKAAKPVKKPAKAKPKVAPTPPPAPVKVAAKAATDADNLSAELTAKAMSSTSYEACDALLAKLVANGIPATELAKERCKSLKPWSSEEWALLALVLTIVFGTLFLWLGRRNRETEADETPPSPDEGEDVEEVEEAEEADPFPDDSPFGEPEEAEVVDAATAPEVDPDLVGAPRPDDEPEGPKVMSVETLMAILEEDDDEDEW